MPEEFKEEEKVELTPEEQAAFEEMESSTKFQKEELGSLLDFFDGPAPGEKKEEEKKPEEKPEEKREEVKSEEKKEEKKEEEKKDPNEEALEVMRAEIARLSGLLARDGKEQVFPAKVEEKKEEKKEEGKKEEKPLNELFAKILGRKEFLSKEQLDKVIDSPELINEAIALSNKELIETLMEAIPLMINPVVNREIAISKAVSSFYSANEDLKPYSSYVQSVLREVEQLHKDKPYSEIFALTAQESRKRLGLKEVSVEKEPQPKPGEKPAFAGQKGGTAKPLAKEGSKTFFDKAAEELMGL